MNRLTNILFLCLVFCCFISSKNAFTQSNTRDSVLIDSVPINKQDVFYDSLKYRANRKGLTRMIYDFLISPPRPYVDKKALALDYYSKFEGKLISEIKIKPLDIFGPSFNDTSRTASNWFEKSANALHTKSNLKSLKKLLLFKEGDFVDPEIIYENERIIRSLPYISDIKVLIEQDTIYTGLVKLLILTKDRFSFGVGGAVGGTKSGELELYNQNIFGVGHELSIRFVGHLDRKPYAGLETYYKVNNFRGKFIDFTTGYVNHYKREGFVFDLNKPFITPTVKWGYGATSLRYFRTNRIFEDDPIQASSPLDLFYLSAWLGRSFSINQKKNENTKIVLSGAFYNRYYFDRPPPDADNNQYYSNSTFYLSSISFTQRRYVQDQLVYSYGITEDIPEGFKNEIIYGFDANEFGDRHYARFSISNGNMLKNKGYIFVNAGIGGFFNPLNYEQGQINAGVNYISKQINAGRKRFRFFTNIRYDLGLKRFDIENLRLNGRHIRGFASAHENVIGKQRLSVNLEYVLFLRKQFYKFNMAVYGFSDIGIIGNNKDLIFTQNYYSGVGLGLRLHNENLVFKTFFIRLAFYPFHPSDMSFIGGLAGEQSKRRYTSFEPLAPEPFPFQ